MNNKIEEKKVLLGITRNPDIVECFNIGREPGDSVINAVLVSLEAWCGYPPKIIYHGINEAELRDIGEVVKQEQFNVSPTLADYAEAKENLENQIETSPSGWIKQDKATLSELETWKTELESRNQHI